MVTCLFHEFASNIGSDTFWDMRCMVYFLSNFRDGLCIHLYLVFWMTSKCAACYHVVWNEKKCPWHGCCLPGPSLMSRSGSLLHRNEHNSWNVWVCFAHTKWLPLIFINWMFDMQIHYRLRLRSVLRPNKCFVYVTSNLWGEFITVSGSKITSWETEVMYLVLLCWSNDTEQCITVSFVSI